MKAKVCKCHSLAVQGSTGKLLDPQLAISGETIPFIGNDSIKFLGMRIQMPHNVTANKELLTANMNRMLIAVDQCPLTCHQKLRLYKAGICPRLSWLLLIEELPISWIENQPRDRYHLRTATALPCVWNLIRCIRDRFWTEEYQLVC